MTARTHLRNWLVVLLVLQCAATRGRAVAPTLGALTLAQSPDAGFQLKWTPADGIQQAELSMLRGPALMWSHPCEQPPRVAAVSNGGLSVYVQLHETLDMVVLGANGEATSTFRQRFCQPALIEDLPLRPAAIAAMVLPGDTALVVIEDYPYDPCTGTLASLIARVEWWFVRLSDGQRVRSIRFEDPLFGLAGGGCPTGGNPVIVGATNIPSTDIVVSLYMCSTPHEDNASRDAMVLVRNRSGDILKAFVSSRAFTATMVSHWDAFRRSSVQGDHPMLRGAPDGLHFAGPANNKQVRIAAKQDVSTLECKVSIDEELDTGP